MSIALITGSCGLVGSESVDFFIKKGLVKYIFKFALDRNYLWEIQLKDADD